MSVAPLLKRLESLQGFEGRAGAILAWVMEDLHLEGAALMEADASRPQGVGIPAAVGSLAAEPSDIGERLARAGLPREPGLMALPAGHGDIDALYFLPLQLPRGAAWGALVLHGAEAEDARRARDVDLRAAAALLRDAVVKERESRHVSGANALSVLLAGLGSAGVPETNAGLAILTDGLHLPLYACDEQGRFVYASPGFLKLTGHKSLEELVRRQDFYADPAARAEELDRARLLGKVSSEPLAVLSGTGKRLQVHDSSVCLGGSFLGVFFDVSSLMAANAELKDSLQVQELLNDSILAGTKILQRTQEASIRSLARLAEFRDQETGFHLQRICEYSRLIALQVFYRAPYSFRVTREYADDISMSSMLHDIGKVSIPDSILLKPGKLDPAEWEIMKKHTRFGWEVLHKADRELGEQSFLTLAATIALCHHERYDGTGYPDGRSAAEIPLSARISSIADVYDALTSERPYKAAWDHERAFQEIISQSGRQFDPVLVEIFRDLSSEFAEVRRQFPG
jgi:HD-GYP domain-containing protein (c-di-GMP phosphodiesterase class II)